MPSSDKKNYNACLIHRRDRKDIFYVNTLIRNWGCFYIDFLRRWWGDVNIYAEYFA